MDKQTIATALAELEAAQQIIKNALNIMTPEQKAEWAKKNEADGIISDGATRANERLAAIHALKEGSQHGAIPDGMTLRQAATHAIDIACLAECYTHRLSSIFFAITKLVGDNHEASTLADLGRELASDWAGQFVDNCNQVEKLLIAQHAGGVSK